MGLHRPEKAITIGIKIDGDGDGGAALGDCQGVWQVHRHADEAERFIGPP
jgi:hypothetical protein